MNQFHLKESLAILSKTPQVVSSVLRGLPEEWLTCREDEDSWNSLEIVAHLIHGENEDWVVRAKIILGDGSKEFEPFEREAGFEGLTPSDLAGMLDRFASLRSSNIQAIRDMNLNEGDYAKTGIHPEFGGVNLRQLLATWVVHDLGHIRQINRTLAIRYKEEVGPWEKYLSILH